ncbi:hypothetical protein [Bacillus thuringiensis]|uniref:Uncharacterized protein n=3 Tax=Bacillus thuringiensis TaxID=1428 RepID=A0A243CVM9_BACTU|nr:hypothetical protein [Bacillus thuringiensis]OTY70827.1 hypothetical protein BK749_21705 [Bacillus thuringiensis serovar vazensis]OTY74948.1 hypothetical protein BK749_14680 [Bacillus thuringiensis serovar vazensis]OTY74979.1 hypothetical protein BK749_14650 [Bacillus thuringiensis serovar vazensis]OTY74992.1 hypothetical protein BK749_14605 [Bacillus thuringiensis serovar vazensis]
MTRRRFFDLCEGDRIKVYSAGRYEGEGIFIRFTEEKHEDFIYWIKRNGNDCYTSLDAINIEKVRYGYGYRYGCDDDCDYDRCEREYDRCLCDKDHCDRDHYRCDCEGECKCDRRKGRRYDSRDKDY